MNILKRIFGEHEGDQRTSNPFEIKPPANRLSSTQQVIIEEIHNSFNNAADNAIKEARQIISGAVEPSEDVAILEQCGFSNVEKVKEAQQTRAKIQLAGKEASLIMMYQQEYPGYKFIMEKQVKEICDKYNLVMGEVSLYKGEVPSKNVKEIGNFYENNPVKEEHAKYCKRYGGWGSRIEECNKAEYDWHRSLEWATGYDTWKETKFQICAPLKDMNMQGKELKGHRIVDIPDPVVLYPVSGGYLVVSKWGLEASDENVVNEKMN